MISDDLSPFRLKNHYVVCNWNDKILPLLKELNPKNVGVKSRTTVVVTEKAISPDTIPSDHESSQYFEDVMFFPGNPSNSHTLRRVNFHDSHCVIVLSNHELGENADANTLLTLFSMIGTMSSVPNSEELENEKEVRNILKNRKIDGHPLHIVAEINDVTNYSKFKIFEDDQDVIVEIVRPESIRTRILAQAARTRGLLNFFVDLMTYSESSNEVYSAKIPHIWFEKDKKEQSFTFTELCLWFSLIRHESQISAIPVGIWRPPHCRAGEFFGTIVNPPETFKIVKGDKVLIICRSRKIADQIENL